MLVATSTRTSPSLTSIKSASSLLLLLLLLLLLPWPNIPPLPKKARSEKGARSVFRDDVRARPLHPEKVPLLSRDPREELEDACEADATSADAEGRSVATDLLTVQTDCPIRDPWPIGDDGKR